jgi:hypothetical protein
MTTPFLQNPMSNYMGPGLGGLWAGEQQQLAVDSSRANTGLTLEQIATQQSQRQINEAIEGRNKELHPLVMDEKRSQNELRGAQTQEIKQKIDRNNYSDYLDDLMRVPVEALKTPAGPAMLADVAKNRKLDPSHPMVQAAQAALMQGPDMFKRLQDAVYAGGEGARKQAQQDTAAMDRQRAGDASREREGAANRANLKDLEQMRIDAGKYNKAQQIKWGLDYELGRQTTATGAMQVVQRYIAQARFDPELQPMLPMLQEMERRLQPQAQAELTARPNPNQLNIPQLSGQPGVAPPQILPGAPPPNVSSMPGSGLQIGGQPQVQQPQLSPIDQQALDWARANPNDPRAARILQKLGVK